ncbi:MAG: hypothetical protein HSCHL_2494 [Hydrogenibacillus schlegelii]|uniref:Uncharacterized protein n=1 Tax=Hydrogenibacillus schlegelii TaxID=1484 RepID=A0A2T5G3T8_HYDSH|nr:MAG: hypothetical protein HSCHL_2494 [Hydrogenibacillus schlegelii]
MKRTKSIPGSIKFKAALERIKGEKRSSNAPGNPEFIRTPLEGKASPPGKRRRTL